MYYLFMLIHTKMSNVPKLQSYIPVNDKNTCNITDLQSCVYGAKFKMHK